MSPTVTFELEVEVDEEFLSEDPSEEEIVDTAYDILGTAPAFDGLRWEFIEERLEVSEIE